MARFVSLANAKTGNIIATSNPDFFDRWDWIIATVAQDFECSADDLTSFEDEEGNDLVKLDGEVIVQVLDGHFRNYEPYQAPVFTHFQQAAE